MKSRHSDVMLTAPNQKLGLYTKPQNSYVRTMKSDFYGAVSVLKKEKKRKRKKTSFKKTWILPCFVLLGEEGER